MAGAAMPTDPIQSFPGTALSIEELRAQVEKLTRQVEYLTKEKEKLKDELDRFRESVKEARKLDKDCVNDLATDVDKIIDKINEHADDINKVWQATKKPTQPKGKKTLARIEQVKEILKSGPRTFKDLERLLKISPKEMNRLVSKLDTRCYVIFYRSGDERQKVIRLRSLTNEMSNVK